MGLDLAEFSRINKMRCEQAFFPLENWSLTDFGCAIAGETGEACNLIKKIRRGDNIDIKEVGKELADIITYCDLLASRLGLNLEECLINKFNEVSDRVKTNIKL